MSRCPTDGPVLKSILGLYRPAADCLPSFLLFLNLLSLSISTNLLFSFFHTQCCLILLYFSLSLLSSVNLLCPISLRLSLLSLIAGPIQPSFSFFFFGLLWFHHTNHPVSSHALCLSITLLPPLMSFLFLLSNSHSLTLSWCFSLRQLMENKITTIERGAFQDLKELERL